ncbi:hypothetical protein [Sorangium sp. So ce385]|uniref:hypothetical protein n=1 Tax=Sorangium sp. So ce385 TaxID=3133308 RepID=UPI003F5C1433
MFLGSVIMATSFIRPLQIGDSRTSIAQACSPLRCHRQPEQPTERLVNDPGRHLILEGDGAA